MHLTSLTSRMTYAAVLLWLLSGACAHRVPETQVPPQAAAPQPAAAAAAPPDAGQPGPATATAPAPVAKTPEPAAPPAAGKPAPPATQAPAPAPIAKAPQPAVPAAGRPAPPTATAPAPVAKAPAPVAPPAAVPPTPAAAPTLDLVSLKDRLKDTRAIGIFTKISLKNKVDDLVQQFREFYAGKASYTMTDLRRAYDLLLMKVLSLLQDTDQTLAATIVSSREAIWGLLADPKKFAALDI